MVYRFGRWEGGEPHPLSWAGGEVESVHNFDTGSWRATKRLSHRVPVHRLHGAPVFAYRVDMNVGAPIRCIMQGEWDRKEVPRVSARQSVPPLVGARSR